jgi:hypothetical protein
MEYEAVCCLIFVSMVKVLQGCVESGKVVPLPHIPQVQLLRGKVQFLEFGLSVWDATHRVANDRAKQSSGGS